MNKYKSIECKEESILNLLEKEKELANELHKIADEHDEMCNMILKERDDGFREYLKTRYDEKIIELEKSYCNKKILVESVRDEMFKYLKINSFIGAIIDEI